MKSSTSLLEMFIGGLMRITLPHSPPLPTRSWLRRQASRTCLVSEGAGSLDSGFLTSSSAC